MSSGKLVIIPDHPETPTKGICTDAAQSEKRKVSEYRGVCLKTGEEIFYTNLGHQTVNIGEFEAIIEGMQWIIKNDYPDKIIWTDSQTAMAWVKYKKTSSNKKFSGLFKSEMFLHIHAARVAEIEVKKWDNKLFGEIPADFHNK